MANGVGQGEQERSTKYFTAQFSGTISPKIITDLTRYRSIVLELI